MNKKTKYIFVTGGVVSSLGKGLVSASLGALLQARGFKVRLRKLDPYLNVDPGTMSPTQHGEVFVTDDGAETDLDIGHYERFTGINAKKGDSITTGQIYLKLIEKERKGEYLGATVQIIPHVTDLIKDFILKDSDNEDFVLCEIGGTVGDIEGQPFFEAIRQIGYEMGKNRVAFVHLTLVPYLAAAKELKTKPTQHSVKELRSIGIQPNILICRADREIPEKELKKIAQFCNIPEKAVISAIDSKLIYEVPLLLNHFGLDKEVLDSLEMEYKDDIDLTKWQNIVEKAKTHYKEITIAIAGKYTKLSDAYKSIIEALSHAAIENNVKLNIKWINSRNITDKNIEEKTKDIDGIIVPGGFGIDGVNGKILAANYARKAKIPYFGICFGMQIAVIEIARNVAQIEDASSSEFGPCKNNVVAMMTEWMKDKKLETRSQSQDLGGTLRLGSYECMLKEGSLARKIYGRDSIRERHRHRYEVNTDYREILEKSGVTFSGLSPDGLPEIIELKEHPWFIGVQFHPELKSRPFAPHPLFNSFVKTIAERKEKMPN
ncbi:MAG: CTP synthase [Rickettsiaceae bacterium]|nr:CTP synthase [Rickettsiaceae bacterium]